MLASDITITFLCLPKTAKLNNLSVAIECQFSLNS